jgi:hypothetical protein
MNPLWAAGGAAKELKMFHSMHRFLTLALLISHNRIQFRWRRA